MELSTKNSARTIERNGEPPKLRKPHRIIYIIIGFGSALRLNKHQECTRNHPTDCRQGGGCPTTSEHRYSRVDNRECRGEGGSWVRGSGHSDGRRTSHWAGLGPRGYGVDDGELGRDDMSETMGMVHKRHVVVIASRNAVKVDVQGGIRCRDCRVPERLMEKVPLASVREKEKWMNKQRQTIRGDEEDSIN